VAPETKDQFLREGRRIEPSGGGFPQHGTGPTDNSREVLVSVRSLAPVPGSQVRHPDADPQAHYLPSIDIGVLQRFGDPT
jgi:hypothetical protein